MVSLEQMEAEERYDSEPRDDRHPEALFSQAWAAELFDQVRQELRRSFEKSGRGALFNVVEPYLLWDRIQPRQSELARLMGSSEGAARVLIFRTRHKFRELLQLEISRTVLSPAETTEELKWLFSMLSER
jgi:hypothetical protein